VTTRRHPPGSVDAMSNNKNPSGLWPRMAALAVMAGVILLASGCGGSSSSNPDASSTAGTSNVAKEVAYSNCMRAHGVNLTVNPNGGFSGGGGGSGSGSSGTAQKTMDSAQDACRHLLPNGGQPNQADQAAQQKEALNQALKYTQCMRSHGVPNFPDPSTNGSGGVGFNHVNAGTPAYAKANQACQSLMPGGGS
jgi:hypothetical protein